MPNREDLAQQLQGLEARLVSLDEERAALCDRVASLRRLLAAAEAATISVPAIPSTSIAPPSTHAEKVALFASLFRGRDDVYPRFWSNDRKGTKGCPPPAPRSGSARTAKSRA
jgi:hypothetical protein